MSYDVPLASLAPFELVKADEGGVVLEQRPVDQSASSGGTQLPPLVYTLEPVGGSTLRVRLGRKGSNGVMENGLKRELTEGKLEGLKVDENDSKTLTFSLSGNVVCTLSFSTCPALTVLDSVGRILHSDFPAKPFTWHPAPGGREGGLQWYSTTRMEDIMMGLGEKAAPVNIARRRWELRATNAAHYDAFNSDPLYKQLPFLLILPNPLDPDRQRFQRTNPDAPPPLVTGIFTPSNAAAVWDLGCAHNDPLGDAKSLTQLEGPLDVFLSWADSGAEVKDGWRSLLKGEGGRDMLASRSWLGYLASTMGQAESDDPPAQELLLDFPRKCKEHGIPVSAMHLSSGYTVDKATGFRMVFQWNHDRYPDFEGLMREYHKDAIKVCANIKPYVSVKHPSFEFLRSSGALFKDPQTGRHSTTLVWSGLFNECFEGSWVDMTSKVGRDWWAKGVKSLVDRGVDSTWNDDNEYTVSSANHLCAWELEDDFAHAGSEGPKTVGLVGGLVNCEIVGQISKTVLENEQPGRRPFVLTRSANVGSLQHVSSSWSGDNMTSWRTMRGNIAQGLNSSVSFLHSYGDDIGGFAGPLPTPELFVRWVQNSVYRSRFCIHSFKPTPESPTGGAEVNSPWMYPEVLPIVKAAIERRYEIIPFLYGLMWEASQEGKAPMTWLGWGPFERDPNVYEEEVLDGQDFWVGTGRVLVAGVYFKDTKERKVYLPSCAASGEADEGYYDLHTWLFHQAGTTVMTPTPLDMIATFVRVGTVIPIGKPCVTITSTSGLPSTTADGTHIQLKSEGGVVDLDDWRGAEIFPPPAGQVGEWGWEWNEDDGESHLGSLKVSRVGLTYATNAKSDKIHIKATWVKNEFKTLWNSITIFLPKDDTRQVEGGVGEEVRGRRGWKVPITL